MKKITKIEPIQQEKTIKHRVAAYARVSTSSEEQLLSLENQKRHYEQRILSNLNWEFVRLYFDEGVSGTKLDKRDGLKQLLKDCEEGKVDLILTKSISRFSRNALDCLKIVRRLNELNVFIEFEKENINTETMDGELILSILSSLAENESKSLSQNTKWSIEKRFQNGTYKIGYPPYGYDWIHGEMVINSVQSKIVRGIFDDVLNGLSTQVIADRLNEYGVQTKRDKQWNGTTIRGIIKNEKYTGDALLAKTYTDDSFKRKKNNGEQDMYLIENHHPAIISKDIFEKANQVLLQNAKSKNISQGNGKYQNRYNFSGLIKCNECGGTFKRRVQIKNKDEKYIAWACSNHLKDKYSCNMKFIRDEQLKQTFVTMINKLIFSNQNLLNPLLANLRARAYPVDESKAEEIDDEMQRLNDTLEKLVQFVANGYIERPVFVKEQQEIIKRLQDLKEEKKTLRSLLSKDLSILENLEELTKFTKKSQMLHTFDDEIFDRFIEEIVVLSRDEIVLNLKCGLKLKERLG